ncbi:MAG: RNA polymerase sigma-70 factor [Niastella sp.]|nr:RNA polymerase sigma-70 factor [Niastella sp.]
MPVHPLHNEKDLLLQVAGGSASAFDALYFRYYEPVWNNIFRITRNEAVTDDILQDVFIRFWERRTQFVNYDKISSWLFVVSHNSALNYLRRLASERTYSKQLTTEVITDWPAEDARQEQQFRLLEEAIAALPPQRRRVFELCRFQGLSYEQAAAELSISKNTVKEHLARATDNIRTYIQTNSGHSGELSILVLAVIMGNWPQA